MNHFLIVGLLIGWIGTAISYYVDYEDSQRWLQFSVALTEKLSKQNDQLQSIITNHGIKIEWRDGEAVVIGEITPLTPEEFERIKEEIRKRKE
jgi:VIT1/CCC1 family predicted Fe2+/Mn2+ transporter